MLITDNYVMIFEVIRERMHGCTFEATASISYNDMVAKTQKGQKFFRMHIPHKTALQMAT